MSRALAILLVVAVCAIPMPTHGESATQASLVSSPWVEIENSSDKLPGPDGRHMRLRLDVDVPAGTMVTDLPVQATIDLAAVLGDPAMAGYPRDPATGRLLGFELDLNSFTIVEVDSNDEPLVTSGKGRLPLQVFPGSFASAQQFDARNNPVVTLRWVLPGVTNGDRHFHAYFDAVHNGPRNPYVPPSEDLARLAAATGPGRGTDLYISLPGVAGDQADKRSIHLTNLRDAPTQVDFYRYLDNQLVPGAFDSITLPAGEGATTVFRYPKTTEFGRTGLLYLKATSPILAEAVDGRTASGFTAGATTAFLPASDGGFVGSTFRQQPAKDAKWHLYCHAVTLGQANQCEGRQRVDGAETSFVIPPGTFKTAQLQAGQRVAIDMDAGRIAVQRVGTGILDRGPSLWPALDGPVLASTFVGDARASSPTETLLMHAPGKGAALTVKDLAGGRTTLADRGQPWDLDQGLTNVDGIGIRWSKQWLDAQGTSARHDDGPVLLEPAFPGDATTRGLHAVNGFIEQQKTHEFSALVPLQSADGGLRYSFSIPGNRDGQPLGRLVLFAPYPATAVTLQSEQGSHSLNLRQHEYVDTWQTGMAFAPGVWSVVADRPVLVAWLKAGQEPMSGFATGVTDLAQVTVSAAQVSGPLIAMHVTPTLRTAKAGETVSFAVAVTNHGRATDGTPMDDGVALSVSAPAGWENVVVDPATLILGPGATQTATVQAKIPQGTDGGAVLRLVAHSVSSQSRDGSLAVTENLVVNVLKKFAVQVVADGAFTSSISKTVDEDSPTATYTVTVRNTGSTQDAFNIQLPAGNDQWDVQIEAVDADGILAPADKCKTVVAAAARTHDLAPGAAATYQVHVGLKPGVEDPFRFIGFFTAVSNQDCSAIDNVKLIAQRQGEFAFSVEVDEPFRIVKPGESTMFLLNLTNEAEQLELNATIVSASPPGWPAPQILQFLDGPDEPPTVLPRDRSLVRLDPLADVHLAVLQEVPADASPLASAVHRVLLQSTDRSRQPSDETILRATAAEVAGFDASLDPPQLATVPGTTATAKLTLTSTGNVPQLVRVDARSLETDPWLAPGPWLVELPPGGQGSVDLEFQVPPKAAPGAAARPVVALGMAADGVPASDLLIRATVEERRSAELVNRDIYVEPGRVTRSHVRVQNTGNLALEASGEFVALPDGWTATMGKIRAPVGATVQVPIEVSVPAGAGGQTVDARIRLLDGPAALTLVPVKMHTGVPQLVLGLAGIEDLASGKMYRIIVQNTGSAPAGGISVVLHGNGLDQDRATIDQLLPGRQVEVTLLATSSLRDVHVVATAAHDPDGVRLQDGLDAVSPDKGAPGLGVVPALLAVAVIVRNARRSKP